MQTIDLSSWVLNEPLPFAATGAREVRSAFDGAPIARASEASMMDIVQALAPAKKALEAFADVGVEERAKMLERIADAIRASEKELALQEARFQGLTRAFVLRAGIRPVENLCRSVAADLRAKGDHDSVKASGLISIIAPAPLAFRSVGDRLIPALAAGNACFVKIPSGSPVTAMLWGRILKEAAAPAGVAAFFLGKASEVGSLLVSHPSIRGVSFAGHPTNVAAVATAAVAGFKKMQISGGAKNSLLILNDANLDQLPQILEGVLMGQGQMGWNLSRIYVTEERVLEFLEKASSWIRSLRPLTSPEGDSPWTPLTSSRTRGAYEKATAQIASDKGAQVLPAGTEGAFHVHPVLTRDLTNCSTLQLEDFGAPVTIVSSVKYAHEMVKWTNTGDYGFCASIWGSEEKAQRLAAKLNVEQVWINGWMKTDGAIAGLKKSFVGIADFSWDGSFYSDVKKPTS